MAIKRYIATADNTITNAYQMDLSTRGTGSNMGAADTLEAFYIFGQAVKGTGVHSQTSEKSRILVQFDVDQMNKDRTNGLIPASGNVAWQLNLYNAPHAFTLPKDYKMVIKVCSGSWQEGTGLDMDNYTDQTYEGTGSNWIRKGAAGDGHSTWLTEGGDFAESSLSVVFTGSFTDGTEDLSVDISDMVEDWMAGGLAADGSFRCTEAGTIPNDYNNSEFSLTDSQGTTFIYKLSTSTSTNSGNIIGISGLSTNNAIAAKIRDAINNTGILRITATAGGSDDITVLTMDDIGLAGNRSAEGGLGNLDVTGSSGDNFGSVVEFSNGEGIPNYGLGVFLSSSFETGSHSYYTKKFFARSSEYFFLRPNLEARWDSTTKDESGNVYLSSSLADGDDNLNTLYYYNFIRGQLKDIPGYSLNGESQSGTIKLYLFSASSDGSKPVGMRTEDAFLLPKGGGVAADGNRVVVGGRHKTLGPGIYTASFAVNNDAVDSFYPVWALRAPSAGSDTQFHTASLVGMQDFLSKGSPNNNPDSSYVTTIENLKATYSRKEEARFRLFVRSKNWNPNNYTISQTQLPSEVIEDAYFSLHRIVDDYEVIAYGTGSALSPQQTGSVGSYTRLSYDISGNYFDLDMSLLQAGYEYGLKFAYYSNGSYKEQSEIFKFKVEE
tara:strand:- start:1387 stop:3375 length:1989 start_codon:yes stop_codon:yes gene_type:complete